MEHSAIPYSLDSAHFAWLDMSPGIFACRRSRSRSLSRSRSVDSRDRKHHSSHKKSKKRHRSRSPDSPYLSYPAPPVEKHKKVRILAARLNHMLSGGG